jgi:hypothetical protein
VLWDLAGGVQNITVDLLKPGQRYGDRVNQIDLRIAKSRKTRSLANAVTASRFLRISTQFDL